MKFQYIFLLISCSVLGQVGINTANPQDILHIDGQSNNPDTGTPNSTQSSDDVLITSSGSLGISTAAPHASAAIDFGATNRGVLIPKVALTSINDITTITDPEEGLLIFNTQNSGTGGTQVKENLFYYFNGSFWEELVTEDNLPEENEKPVEIKKIQTTGDLSTPLTIVNGPLEFELASDNASAVFAIRPVGAYTNDISISKSTWSGIGLGKGGNKTTHTFNATNWTSFRNLGNISNEGVGQIIYLGINSGVTEPIFYMLFFQRIGDANQEGTLKTLIIKRY